MHSLGVLCTQRYGRSVQSPSMSAAARSVPFDLDPRFGALRRLVRGSDVEAFQHEALCAVRKRLQQERLNLCGTHSAAYDTDGGASGNMRGNCLGNLVRHRLLSSCPSAAVVLQAMHSIKQAAGSGHDSNL